MGKVEWMYFSNQVHQILHEAIQFLCFDQFIAVLEQRRRTFAGQADGTFSRRSALLYRRVEKPYQDLVKWAMNNPRSKKRKKGTEISSLTSISEPDFFSYFENGPEEKILFHWQEPVITVEHSDFSFSPSLLTSSFHWIAIYHPRWYRTYATRAEQTRWEVGSDNTHESSQAILDSGDVRCCQCIRLVSLR